MLEAHLEATWGPLNNQTETSAMSPRPKHLSELLLRKSCLYRFTRTRSQKMKSFHIRGNEGGASVRRIYSMPCPRATASRLSWGIFRTDEVFTLLHKSCRYIL